MVVGRRPGTRVVRKKLNPTNDGGPLRYGIGNLPSHQGKFSILARISSHLRSTDDLDALPIPSLQACVVDIESLAYGGTATQFIYVTGCQRFGSLNSTLYPAEPAFVNA